MILFPSLFYIHVFRVHPKKVAVDFLEFVGRTGGAAHLKVASGHLNLAQYYSLDTAACLVAAISLLLGLVTATLRKCVASTRGKLKKD